MMDDDVVNRIVEALKKNPSGLTITNLVELLKISRSSIRTGLAKLEGAKLVQIKPVGMAKVYFIFRGKK